MDSEVYITKPVSCVHCLKTIRRRYIAGFLHDQLEVDPKIVESPGNFGTPELEWLPHKCPRWEDDE